MNKDQRQQMEQRAQEARNILDKYPDALWVPVEMHPTEVLAMVEYIRKLEERAVVRFDLKAGTSRLDVP